MDSLQNIISILMSIISLISETFCATSISNGDLPQDCTSRVDETCNGFTCISGYKRNEGVANLTCAESGQWSHDPSDLCIGVIYLPRS